MVKLHYFFLSFCMLHATILFPAEPTREAACESFALHIQREIQMLNNLYPHVYKTPQNELRINNLQPGPSHDGPCASQKHSMQSLANLSTSLAAWHSALTIKCVSASAADTPLAQEMFKTLQMQTDLIALCQAEQR